MTSMTHAMPYTPADPVDRPALSELGFTYPQPVTDPILLPAPVLPAGVLGSPLAAPAKRTGRRKGAPSSLLAEVWAAGFHKPLRGQGRHVARGTR